VGVGLGGIALIAGGAWWGFKKGRERQVVENLAPAPEYTGGEHGGNGGARARLSVLMRMRSLLGLCGLRSCMAQMGEWRWKLDFDLLLPSVLLWLFYLFT